MFTGIVETTGIIKGLSRKKNAYRLRILAQKNLTPLKEGDSLSINGTCLTMTSAKENFLFFDIMEKTFTNTTFMYLKNNDVVNIEMSLGWKSRVEGHFVLGHIDSIQRIKAMRKESPPYMDVGIAKNEKRYIVKKGSVAIDGISLTIGDIFEDKIRVYIIPYTLLNTNLKYKKTGDRVNIEFDILGKYIQEKSLSKDNVSSVVTEVFLKDRGFI